MSKVYNDLDNCSLYNGKRFVVTIDRGSAERRYILNTIDDDGQMYSENEPMYFDEFRKHYGFSEEWPHPYIKQ